MPETAILITTTDINWGHQGGARRAQGRAEGRKEGQEGRQGGQEGCSALLFWPSWNTVLQLLSHPSPSSFPWSYHGLDKHFENSIFALKVPLKTVSW